MKQRLDKKNMQQFRDDVSLLTEIKLKENDGTHNTSASMRDSEILIVPMCVTRADSPLGSSTVV